MELNRSTLASFASPCPEQGKLELVHYTSRAYALEALFHENHIPMEKNMWVYTPYGYDPGKKYNVLFLMHGGTDNEGYWFGTGRYHGDDTEKYTDFGNITAGMVDRLIYEREIDPLIIVAPSFEEEVEPYINMGNRAESYFAVTHYFWLELRNEIMPCIQQHYSTYAKEDSEEAYRKARDHFAYAGASQGSITGLFSVMPHCLDRFSYIGSFSAGSIKFVFDGKSLSIAMDEAQLQKIADAVGSDPIRLWYCGCGDADDMYATHKETYERMLAEKAGAFEDGKNCCFVTHPGGIHHYRCWIEDLYHILHRFFR